ncbi:hypothetical protein DPMN_025105, partial [Dreissena polymorpha]
SPLAGDGRAGRWAGARQDGRASGECVVVICEMILKEKKGILGCNGCGGHL